MKQLSLLAESLGDDSLVPESTSGSAGSANVHENHQYLLNFDQIVGQTLAISLLTSAIATNRITPAYLFAGIEGIGKTLAARIYATKLLGTDNLTNHPDLLILEPTFLHQGNLVSQKELVEAGIVKKSPPQVRIEQIQGVTQFLSSSPITGRKVVIITQAERMNPSAANALLKTLEEPKGSNCIILLSSDTQKLLPTIFSRCSVIPFQALSLANLTAVFETLGRSDLLMQPSILAMAAGNPGLAISCCNQWQSLPPDLLVKLAQFPSSIVEALQITSDVIALDAEQQRWLLDYLQHQWWNEYQDGKLVARVEAAKSALNKSVTPRLVWDVLLLP